MLYETDMPDTIIPDYNAVLNIIDILKYLMYKLYIRYKGKEKIHGHKNIYSRRQKEFR